jgi:DNA-binding phage protein
MGSKTGFDRYLDKRMKDPGFASEYEKARAEIDATDVLIRALEAAREDAGVTKADLARKTGSSPVIIRRLLTADDGNPTMATVLTVAQALGYHLELVPNHPPTPGHRRLKRRVAARQSRGR